MTNLLAQSMSKIITTEDVLGGAPRIDGRRIGVHHIATRVLDAGTAPGQVAADFDLDLADIHRALAYYYDRPEEMREVRERRNELVHGERSITEPEDFGLVYPGTEPSA